MDLSVVVISRNEEAAIAACLKSLLAGTAGLETEIILVDSASTDRTVEIANYMKRKAAAGETVFGPNRLRGNPAVSRYMENERGIPEFVEGQLAAQPAARPGGPAQKSSYAWNSS